MAGFRAPNSWALALVFALAGLTGSLPVHAHQLTLQGLGGLVPDDRAVTAQPAPRTRSLFDRRTLWDTGQKLSVCFISGTPRARARVASHAAEWTRFANITLDFGAASALRTCSGTGSEDIKIDFVRADGHWSFIGRGSRQRTRSMNLAGFGDDQLPSGMSPLELRRHVLHEFGHALGLKHEHQSPAARCDEEIDWPVAYQFYEARQRWTREQTDQNLRRLTTGRDEFSAYDPQSIMHYQLPEQFLKGGRANRCFVAVSFDLSAGDRSNIAKLYPGRTTPTEQVATADPRQTGTIPLANTRAGLQPARPTADPRTALAKPAIAQPAQPAAARPVQPFFIRPDTPQPRPAVAAARPVQQTRAAITRPQPVAPPPPSLISQAVEAVRALWSPTDDSSADEPSAIDPE